MDALFRPRATNELFLRFVCVYVVWWPWREGRGWERGLGGMWEREINLGVSSDPID